MPPNVPARKEADIGAAKERQYGVQRSKGADRKGPAFFRPFGTVPALQRADLPHGPDFADGTKKSHQCGYVVGTET
jgi:hypothetical protein